MKTIRKGYKQTDIGIIPEDWEVVGLSSLGTFYKGKGIPKSAANSGNVGAVRYGELYTDFNNYIINPKTYISIDVAKNAKKIQGGDILFAGSGETKEEIGKCATLLYNNECYAGGDIIIFRPNTCNALFLGFVLNIPLIQTQKATKGQGDAVVHISTNSLQQLIVALPKNTDEQQAIAEVLRDIDSLIEVMDKKIAKKRAIKEGAMQQLLIGRKRLSGFSKPWIEVELKEDLYFQPGHPFQSSYFNTDRNGVRLIRNRDLKSDDQVIFYNGIKLDDFIVESGDLLVSMDGDFSPTIWMKGTALLNQRVGRIRSKGSWSLQYFSYALIKPLQIIQNGVGATTVKHLSHNQVENMTLCIPSSRQEQQAIAQILTDMDDEIEQLEKQRAKYSYLKQGAIQKLLTGEIRLVKAAAQPQKSAEIRTIPVSAHIVGGHIVNKLHDSKGWGRTKLQKSIHLVSYCCQIDVGARFIRNTAGPDDQELMNHIDSKFKLYRQVDIETTTDNNGRKHCNYTPTSMIDEVEQAFENYPAETQKAANDLLAKIWKMDLARAEIVSTLYAVWNNRIIKKQPINNTLLLEDFYDWSEHKADFSQDLVLRALNYMNREGIIPIGWGKYIDKK